MRASKMQEAHLVDRNGNDKLWSRGGYGHTRKLVEPLFMAMPSAIHQRPASGRRLVSTPERNDVARAIGTRGEVAAPASTP
jgi:G:T/U-mismatch repair DNA glycosylase